MADTNRDGNGNMSRGRGYRRAKATSKGGRRASAPGQLKKAAGAKSAKAFAPGQTRKTLAGATSTMPVRKTAAATRPTTPPPSGTVTANPIMGGSMTTGMMTGTTHIPGGGNVGGRSVTQVGPIVKGPRRSPRS